MPTSYFCELRYEAFYVETSDDTSSIAQTIGAWLEPKYGSITTDTFDQHSGPPGFTLSYGGHGDTPLCSIVPGQYFVTTSHDVNGQGWEILDQTEFDQFYIKL